MARTLNSSYIAIPTLELSALQPIAQTRESDVAENVNFLHGKAWPTIIQQQFQDSTTDPYIEPTDVAYVVNCIWRRRTFNDAASLSLEYYCENGGSQSATIKADLASDAATYVQTDTINASTSAAWTGMTLTQDPSQTRDTLRLYTKEDLAGAALKIHALQVRPSEFSSVPSGKTNEGVLPMDSVDYATNEPLSTWLRQVEFDNLEIIRKTRSDTIVAWSGDWKRTGSEYYSQTSSSYVLVAEIEFQSGIGQDTIEASVTGFRNGTSGSIKLATGYMEDVLGTSVEQSLSTKAASPYTSNIHDTSDLSCLPNKSDVLRIYLKGDGSSAAVMMGVCAWFGDVA